MRQAKRQWANALLPFVDHFILNLAALKAQPLPQGILSGPGRGGALPYCSSVLIRFWRCPMEWDGLNIFFMIMAIFIPLWLGGWTAAALLSMK